MANHSKETKEILKKLRERPLSDQEREITNKIANDIAKEFNLETASDHVKMNIYAKQMLMQAKLEQALSTYGITTTETVKGVDKVKVSDAFYAWQSISQNILGLLENLDKSKRRKENKTGTSSMDTNYNVLIE